MTDNYLTLKVSIQISSGIVLGAHFIAFYRFIVALYQSITRYPLRTQGALVL